MSKEKEVRMRARYPYSGRLIAEVSARFPVGTVFRYARPWPYETHCMLNAESDLYVARAGDVELLPPIEFFDAHPENNA